MVALAGFAGKRVTPVRRLGTAACEGELLRCDLRKTSACDRRLTVGDAAVIDGYGVGDQDNKARTFELAGEELKQKSVHEHAARERDGVDALAYADIAGDVCRGARDGDMEVEREPVGGRSGFNSLQKCLKECFLVQNMGTVQPRWARCRIAGAVVGKTGDFAVERAPGGGFELDGGFALVGCLAANAQNRGCGIKQATHAAGTRAVDVALDHRCRYAARLLVKAGQESRGARVLEQVELT